MTAAAIRVGFRDIPPATVEDLLDRLRRRSPAETLCAVPLPKTAVPGADARAARGARAAVMVLAPGDPAGSGPARDPAVEPPVRIVYLQPDADGPATDKAVAEIAGWIRALGVRPRLEPQHLRPRLALERGTLGRRELFTSIGRVRHEVVPAVAPAACAGDRCLVCADSCPAGAIGARSGRAAIDPRRCTGCGACVAACPVAAIRVPGATREEINACLAEILGGGSADGARVVAFTCAGWDGGLPPPYLECQVPCVAYLTPWALLRALSLGAAGVAIVTAHSPCRERHQSARLEADVRQVRLILEPSGIDADRIAVLDDPSPRRLEEFAASARRTQPLGRGRRPGERTPPLTLGGLVTRMMGDGRLAATRVTAAPEMPFAAVEVDTRRCSLCGLCALCPTGAISRREDAGGAGLRFDYGACTACGLCARVCPEKALRLTRVFDPACFARGAVELVTSGLVSCEGCGEPIASGPMLDTIRRRMTERRAAPETIERILRRCPACRLAGALAEPVES